MKKKWLFLILIALVSISCLGKGDAHQTVIHPILVSIPDTVASLPADNYLFNPPNDSYFSRQWALIKIEGIQAWQITKGRPDIVIAVLDTGIDKDHEDLAGKVIAEVNFTDSPTAGDLYGHGTHVAGIIAATADNGIGIAGLAPRCRLLNVKVADDQGVFLIPNAAKGIVWAVDHGANVINLSIASLQPSPELEKAIDYAWSKGVVVVAAGGTFVGAKLVYPAYYPNCIAVAVTDIDDYVVSWSSKGDWIDVAAPGKDIYSTLPGNQYGTKSGSSMAAAHVSGLAGLLFTIESDNNGNGFVNDEVREVIQSSGVSIGGFNKKRVDALKAVQQAIQ